ncbi:MAG TPA: substrate-binding domain-containing protein [Burkholderiales bacterium]
MGKAPAVRLIPAIVWHPVDAPGTTLDERLLRLLAAIGRHATLRAAAAATGLSYRAAWGLLADTARLLGVSLVELHQGRGARLTPAGRQLLDANERLLQRLQNESVAIHLPLDKAAPRRAPGRPPLTISASHDLLLAAFCEQWARPEGIVNDLVFRGSLESLKALARGDADIAGFHSVAPLGDGLHCGVRRLLDPRRDVLLRFAEREQGLIVPKGNPRGLRSLPDVAAQQVLFVNRQRGSGTRALIDELLREAGIEPTSIRGYETEEYTHLAVAATIAAGHAEAGVGLRAAAVRFGLDFVPLRKEVYWLALRSKRVDSEPVRRLRAGLAGEPLHAAARGLPGYSIEGAGAITRLANA